MSTNEPKKVSILEANRVVKEGLASNDAIRVDGLQNLSRLRSSKAKVQSRELNRLTKKYDKNNALVIRSSEKLDANIRYISNLKMEGNRVSTEKAQCDSKSWIAHGRVYDRTGCPIGGANVSLYRSDGKAVEEVKPVKSNARGEYLIIYRASDETLKRAKREGSAEKAGLRINTNLQQKSMFLRAVDSSEQSLCADSTLMVSELGKCNYRDLIIDTDLSAKQESDLNKDRRASRYLGNSSTRELHDIKNEQRRCQIDNIRADHCVRFGSLKEARSLNYDFCAYCFGKVRSRR